MISSLLSSLVLAALGALLTLATLRNVGPRLPKRRNFALREIPTSAGVCFIPIILITLVVVALFSSGDGTFGVFVAGYLLLAVVLGFVDDVWGGTEARGFTGHIGELLRGRVTTGMLKVFGLGGGALVVGWTMFGFRFEGLVAAFLIAGCANLGNLFDVRPGRAIKFTGIPVFALLFVAPAGATLGVSGVFGGAIALFYFDLKGRIMLGDAGAAVMGSVLGCLVAATGPGMVWLVAGTAVVVLTLVAEFSSISRLIQEVGALRWLDTWGRDRFE